MSDAILAKKQKEDDHAQILNQFLADQTDDGTYGFTIGQRKGLGRGRALAVASRP